MLLCVSRCFGGTSLLWHGDNAFPSTIRLNSTDNTSGAASCDCIYRFYAQTAFEVHYFCGQDGADEEEWSYEKCIANCEEYKDKPVGLVKPTGFKENA